MNMDSLMFYFCSQGQHFLNCKLLKNYSLDNLHVDLITKGLGLYKQCCKLYNFFEMVLSLNYLNYNTVLNKVKFQILPICSKKNLKKRLWFVLLSLDKLIFCLMF